MGLSNEQDKKNVGKPKPSIPKERPPKEYPDENRPR